MVSARGGYNLVVSSRALVDACARLGVDATLLLKTVGLERALLDDPDARLPNELVARLWREAYALSGDPNLALHAVEALEPGAYKVIDFLAGHASTTAEAFTKIAKYFPLINTAIRLPIAIGKDEVCFGMQPLTTGTSISLPYAEYTLAACYLRTKAAVGDFTLRRVCFTQKAPQDSSEHERIFACPVFFESKHLQLVIDREVWQRPSSNANPLLLGVLDDHARSLMDSLPATESFSDIVQEAIALELQGGEPTLPRVAQRVGVSERSLQRQLQSESQSFATILSGLRESLAKQYLIDQNLAISEIAFLLGFSEQSAFQRAFKRWTGETPRQFRDQRHSSHSASHYTH